MFGSFCVSLVPGGVTVVQVWCGGCSCAHDALGLGLAWRGRSSKTRF